MITEVAITNTITMETVAITTVLGHSKSPKERPLSDGKGYTGYCFGYFGGPGNKHIIHISHSNLGKGSQGGFPIGLTCCLGSLSLISESLSGHNNNSRPALYHPKAPERNSIYVYMYMYTYRFPLKEPFPRLYLICIMMLWGSQR